MKKNTATILHDLLKHQQFSSLSSRYH